MSCLAQVQWMVRQSRASLRTQLSTEQLSPNLALLCSYNFTLLFMFSSIIGSIANIYLPLCAKKSTVAVREKKRTDVYFITEKMQEICKPWNFIFSRYAASKCQISMHDYSTRRTWIHEGKGNYECQIGGYWIKKRNYKRCVNWIK